MGIRLKLFFRTIIPRQSAQYLRSSSAHVRRVGLQNLWLFREVQEILLLRAIQNHGDANRVVDNEQKRFGPMN